MLTQLRTAFLLLLTLTALTGIVYPLAVTGIAQIGLPHQANGSLITTNNRARGSLLIGQPFEQAKYLWGRLSATSPFPYTAAASSGSNRGPLNPRLVASAQARIAALKRADPQNTQPIPVDLVTASGSGLDPHISVAAALYQIPRVARARGLSEARVRQLVAAVTQARQFGFLGEPRVNVLQLNLALDMIQ